MPKRKKLTIMEYPELEIDRPYTVRVVAADVVKDTLSVTIKHTEVEQEGRLHLLTYSLPLRPSSVSASLFGACGMSTDTGAEVEPTAIVGKAVAVLFGLSADDRTLQPAAFEPLDKERDDGHGTR